ncbi:MAG: IclR family transcriptional regulator [Rhodobacter sp.]|nr:IclR family transcriptional regulator [Rhodobacter sp.]
MNVQKDHKNQGIQVISRAADILATLAEDTGGLSLGQIARKVKLPRSTVQRIVSALGSEGFVTTDSGNGGIRLGPQIQTLAQASARDARDRLRPLMQGIAEATGETVDLAVLDGGKMLFVDQIVGRQRLRTVSSIGERFPLTTTANGKAALSCLDPAQAAKLIIAEFEAEGRPGAPLTDLLKEIDLIRAGDLATDENEHTEGICAAGFAIVDPGGEIYALSVPVPSTRYDRIKSDLQATLKQWRVTFNA